MNNTQIIATYGSLDDLLFRGKNKNYGAYVLRREYDKRLQSAFIIFFSTLFLLVGSYGIRQFFYELEIENKDEIIREYRVDTEFTKVIQDKIKEWTSTKQIDAQTIQDIPPKIVEQVPQEDDLKTREEIIQSDAIIDNKDNEGNETHKPELVPTSIGESKGEISVEKTSDIFEFYEVQKEPEFQEI